jgi:hypothetical protein
MEKLGMKQNSTNEEVKSKADKRTSSQLSSLADLPLWLITSFVLTLVSLVSLVYYFFAKRSKPGSLRGKSNTSQPFQTWQAKENVQQGFDIIKNKPVFTASVPNVEKSAQKQDSDAREVDTLGNSPFFELLWDRLKVVIGPLIALMVAYFAQGIFDSTTLTGVLRDSEWLVRISESNRLWIGAGLYLIAVLIWVFTAPAMRSIGSIVNPSGTLNAEETRFSAFRPFLLIIGIVIYVISVMLFFTNGENSLVRVLWGLGLVCFILSQLPGKTPHPEAEESPRFEWHNWLVLALILVVGFWLRYYQIATIPDDLHGDMASHGQLARDFLLGTKHDIFGFGWVSTPTIGFLPAFLTMAVFGNNILGLQMAAVIGGVFSLFAIYLLTWRLFNSHRLATLTMALVAINVFHIHFSRIFNMDPWPLSNFVIFLFIDGLKARRSTSFGLAGVFLGFSLLMYTSARVLPFVIIVFLVYVFLYQRPWLIQNKRGLGLIVIGVIITMGPALIFYLMNWGIFVSRGGEVFIFSPMSMAHLLNKYHTDSPFVVLLTQIKLSLLMFNQTGDTSSQFGYPHPMFHSLISPLILLGLGFALRRWKDASMTFVLIWLGLTAIMGSVLTIDAPFWPRLVGIVTPAAVLIAVAFDQVLQLVRKTIGAHAGMFAGGLIAILLAAVGYLNWTQYYQTVSHNASAPAMVGRYINRLPPNVTACGLLSGPQLTVRETYFLAWPHNLVDIHPDAPDSELDTCTGPALVWVISPENIGRLDAIRARWPNGILQEHEFAGFDYTITFYLVGVTPPVPQSEAPSNVSAAVYGTYIFIVLIFCGALIWAFARNRVSKVPPEPQVKKRPDILAVSMAQSAPSRPAPAATLRNEFADVYARSRKWYNEFIGFKFTAASFKLLPSTYLPLVAIGLAYFAQTYMDREKPDGIHIPFERLYMTSEENRMLIACLIFLVAALLWVFTTRAAKTISHQEQSGEQTTAEIQPLQNGKTYQQAAGKSIPTWGASVFLMLVTMVLYAVFGENNLVRWLWVATLILFLVSIFAQNRVDSAALREESPLFRWHHTLALFFLLALAFCLRVYRLSDVPLDLSTDMASVGINARNYLLGTEQLIFGTGWFYYPRIVFLPYAVSMATVGNNLFGLYFATVVMGTLNVLGAYLFVWRLFDRHRLALLTATLMTISPVHINYSRISSMLDPWFWGFFGLFFFFDGLKGRRKVSLALAGLFIGFTLMSTPSGRAIIPMIGVGLAFAWLYKRRWVTDNYGGLIWMALGVSIAMGPNLVYAITDFSTYMQRANEVSIFALGNLEHLRFTYKTDSMWVIVWEQVKRSVLQFNYYNDRSAQFSYPHPMFNSLVSPMLVLGCAMSLYRLRKLEFLFVTSSFVVILITGSVLTRDAPTWSRMVGIIPFAALFIALAMDEFVNVLERTSLKPFVPLLLVGITLFLGVLAVKDWNIYLREVENEDITRAVVQVARYLDSLPDEITACGLTDEYIISQEEILFLGWPRSIVVVPADTPTLTPNLCPSQNVVWILAPAFKNRLSELQAQWPDGIVEDHITKGGWHVFTSYLVFNKNTP